MRKVVRSGGIAAMVVLSLASALWASVKEDKATHPDGSLAYRVPVNTAGQWNGTYTAYWPGGKKVRERSQYDHGDLNGTRELFDEAGKLTAEQTWVHGRLVCPKSVRQIEAMRGLIARQAAEAVMRLGTPTNPHAPSADVLARALAKVNTYRYLADVQPDVALDDSYLNLAQYASDLLTKVGHLTHNPERPDGVDDRTYELGKKGCGQSNLFVGGDAVASVDAYMNDSDPGNIDRLGHRRWVLNPKMAKTGFGQAGKFSALYSFDASRAYVPDYDFVCYPPRGYCPAPLFNANWAWHVSVNPAEYTVGDDAALTIYPVDSHLQRGPALELNYRHVDRGGFGIPNAVIARPKGFVVKPGTVFEVVVTGVKAKAEKTPEVDYFVTFY